MRTKLLVLLFCWVGMVGIKSGNACGKDKDENAVCYRYMNGMAECM